MAPETPLPESPSTRPTVLELDHVTAADLLESRANEAAELMTAETGAVGPWGMFNVFLATEMLREAAASVTRPVGEVLPTSTPGAISLSIRQPAGVVASFAPWNAPIILGTRSIAAPLAAGTTVVMKPSEQAPLSAGLFLADVLHEAGFPPGTCNVVTTAPEDAAAVAEALIADPRVRRVSFTGSTGVGRQVGELAARYLTPAVLELGGKNSVIVLDDADLEYAVNAIAFAAYSNSGQICMCADRIVVQRPVADEVTARLAEKASKLPFGDPRDPGHRDRAIDKHRSRQPGGRAGGRGDHRGRQGPGRRGPGGQDAVPADGPHWRIATNAHRN